MLVILSTPRTSMQMYFICVRLTHARAGNITLANQPQSLLRVPFSGPVELGLLHYPHMAGVQQELAAHSSSSRSP
jgi:hypothetical protein